MASTQSGIKNLMGQNLLDPLRGSRLQIHRNNHNNSNNDNKFARVAFRAWAPLQEKAAEASECLLFPRAVCAVSALWTTVVLLLREDLLMLTAVTKLCIAITFFYENVVLF